MPEKSRLHGVMNRVAGILSVVAAVTTGCGARSGLFIEGAPLGSSPGGSGPPPAAGADLGSDEGRDSAAHAVVDGCPAERCVSIEAVSAGGQFACALLSGGTVDCWGYNDVGQLGNGTETNSAVPVPVSGLANVTAISAGSIFACALLAGGTVECWGDNATGAATEQFLNAPAGSVVPVPIRGLAGVTAISAGADAACALLSGGTVECWGSNSSGQLGNGTTTGGGPTPVAVPGIAKATAISVGVYAACALLSGGTVECWGSNPFYGGAPGTGVTVPIAVSGPPGVTAISVGANDMCELAAGGIVECLGSSAGTGSVVIGAGATAISDGNGAGCAVVAENNVECWGSGADGLLGNGTATGSIIPVPISGLMGATAVSVGGDLACALLAGSTVECWGDSIFGQLGNGTATTTLPPLSPPVRVVF